MKTSVALGGAKITRKPKLKPEEVAKSKEELENEINARKVVMKHLATNNAIFRYTHPRTKVVRAIMITSFLPTQPTACQFVYTDSLEKDKPEHGVLGFPMACPYLVPVSSEEIEAL
jgi:predicted metal-dependent RNase